MVNACASVMLIVWGREKDEYHNLKDTDNEKTILVAVYISCIN